MEEPYNKLSAFLAKVLGKRWTTERSTDLNDIAPIPKTTTNASAPSTDLPSLKTKRQDKR